MKYGTILLNFARDKLVNELDLAVVLESGKLIKYVTDFPNDNIAGRENVILLPHLGASTAEAEDNCAAMAVNEIRNYFENGNIINSVNFPKLDMGALEKGIRLAFMIKDVPDAALAVMELLSEAGIKYSQVMASRREDGISYVLVEIAQEELPALLFKGEKGAKIIKYRAIEK